MGYHGKLDLRKLGDVYRLHTDAGRIFKLEESLMQWDRPEVRDEFDMYLIQIFIDLFGGKIKNIRPMEPDEWENNDCGSPVGLGNGDHTMESLYKFHKGLEEKAIAVYKEGSMDIRTENMKNLGDFLMGSFRLTTKPKIKAG